MKLKFKLLLVTAFLLVSSSAMAFQSTYFNFNNLTDLGSGIAIPTLPFGGVYNGITGEFEELGYAASTTSVITSGNILDSGIGTITSLLDFVPPNLTPAELDSEGLGVSWNITFSWNDLAGYVTSLPGDDTLRSRYTSGTINFYLNEFALAAPGIVIDSELLAVVNVNDGGYALDMDPLSATYLQGPYTIKGVMDVKIDNFWFLFGSDLDLANFQMGWVQANTQGDNNDIVIIPGNSPGDFTVLSNHNSSLRVGVVPEPTTFVLLGIGLLGTAGIARRKKQS